MKNKISIHYTPHHFDIVGEIKSPNLPSYNNQTIEISPNKEDIVLAFSYEGKTYTPTIEQLFEVVRLNFQPISKDDFTSRMKNL